MGEVESVVQFGSCIVLEVGVGLSESYIRKTLPVIIWMIRYQMSFSTSAVWMTLTTTSTYQIKF